jgi:hypothetical protein
MALSRPSLLLPPTTDYRTPNTYLPEGRRLGDAANGGMEGHARSWPPQTWTGRVAGPGDRAAANEFHHEDTVSKVKRPVVAETGFDV